MRWEGSMDRHELTMERDTIDISQSGLFGGGADTLKREVPGTIHYFIDGKPATIEQISLSDEEK